MFVITVSHESFANRAHYSAKDAAERTRALHFAVRIALIECDEDDHTRAEIIATAGEELDAHNRTELYGYRIEVQHKA